MTIENKPLPFQGLSDHDAFEIEPQFAANVRNVRSFRDRIVRSPGGTFLADAPIPAVNPGAGSMVGSFIKSTTTGNQVVPHTLGTTPAAIILFTSYNTADSAMQVNIEHAFGFTDKTTSRCISVSSLHASNDSHTTRAYTNALLSVVNWAAATVATCQYVAATSTSFTINWTTNDTVAGIVGFAVIGAAGVTAKVREWTLSTAAGAQSVAGVGFTPQLVFHLYNNRATAGVQTNGQFGIGAMATNGGQFSLSRCMRNGVAVSQSVREQESAYCMAMQNVAAPYPNPDYKVGYVSMDADGFTVNKVDPPSSSMLVASLCLSGMVSAYIGTFNQPSTSSMPVRDTVTGIGFRPQFLFTQTGFQLNAPSLDPVGSDVGFAYAMSDGANQVATSFADDNNVGFTADRSITVRRGFQTFITPNGPQQIGATAMLFSTDLDGFTTNWTQVYDSFDYFNSFIALNITASSTIGAIGIPRNYPEVYVDPSGPAVQKYVMLTHKSAFIYSALTSSTGIFQPTTEVYTGNQYQRFSIANTQGIAAWSQGVDNIREWDGTSFTSLVTSGTDHAARAVLAFADRIVSVRPYYAAADHPTQIRWCVSGDVNDWAGTGSGSLEIIETSQDPLITGFVLGDRAFLAKRKELIELIWTGTESPVFGTLPRVRGMGVLAAHSVGLAEQIAFWLGPDDIYMFDGSTLTAIGERVYNTITSLIDYQNLDVIQGAVYTPDSEYHLVVPPYKFIYNYRRDIWDWDDVQDFQAIGIYNVGSGANFTADIDKSTLIVVGDSFARTTRVDFQATDWIGSPIDSYFETKDYTVDDIGKQGGMLGRFQVSLWDLNSLREVRFQSPPGNLVEVGISLDRGVTWEVHNVTVNSYGVGVAWFQRAFSMIRFRFRDYGTDTYEIRGSWGFDVEQSGYNLP